MLDLRSDRGDDLMPIVLDDRPPEPQPVRLPGDFARHPNTGAPYVTSPTATRKRKGNKPELLAAAQAAGIELPPKVTVDQLHELLGPEPAEVMYGRPSSLGKQIENTTNLQKWSERAVALGCFLNPDLFAELEQQDDAHYNLDDAGAKALLDGIAVQAKRAAQAGIAAERGTHTHALTEDADNERDWIERARAGEDLGIPADTQAALVDAWERMLATEGIEILAVESAVVDDIWRQAGTLDRIARLTRDRQFVLPGGEIVTIPAGWVGVLDVKTGRLRTGRDGHPDHWHGYAVQIASYAQAVPYDPDTGKRGAWPWPIDQRWGIIAHLDVLAALNGDPSCRLVLVDLEAGRAAGALCVAAREWEKRRDVFSIVVDTVPASGVDDAAAGAPGGGAGGHDPAPPVPAPVVAQPAAEPVPPSGSAATIPQRVICARGRCSKCGRTVNLIGHQCGPAAEPVVPDVIATQATKRAADRRTALLARYQSLNDDCKRAYVALGVDKDDLDAVERALDQVDPFAQHAEPATREPSPPATEPERPVDQLTIDALVDAIKASEHRALINRWVGEGDAAGAPWNPRVTHRVVDFERARAALRLADAASGDLECTILLIQSATGMLANLPVGQMIGRFTVAECAAVIAIAEAFGNTLGLRFDDDGHARLEGDIDAVLATVRPAIAA